MSRAVVLLCLLASCVVGNEPRSGDDTAVGEEPKVDGVITAPRHGDVVGGDTRLVTVEAAGFHSQPSYRIDVQVLDEPSAPSSWITIGTTLTAQAPSENGLYAWRLLVSPAREAARRWPQGGVVRMRVLGSAGETLRAMFHDSDDEAPVQNGIILVSPSPTPAEAAIRARFLDRRNAVDAAETAEYYAAIDAPPTLADFRTRFGFANDPALTFYNAGDLGIGREMHCGAQPDGGVACYVSNYGTFGGDRAEALAAAIRGTDAGGSAGAFATVAMVYTPPASAPNSVKFVVYDAVGALASQAQLDQFGDNVSIPNNCLNCHGGARYDAMANAVTNAKFLPFDPSGFEFADLPGYRADDLAPRIRAFNELVKGTEPTQGIRELIDGFDAMPARDFVPAGWSATTVEKQVYTEVVAVACRSCHASLGGALELSTAESFKTYRAAIADSLCGPSGTEAAHDMPSAEVPLRRLWTSPARAYLIDYLGITGACEP